MVQIVRLCVFAAIALLATSERLSAQSPPPSQSITVRVYDVFDVGAHEMKAAQRIVAEIFDHAGFKVAWRMCPRVVSADSPPPCNDSVQPTEVLVRVGTAPAKTDPVVLGYSYVDPETRMGTLSTVFADRVKRHAARARVPFATLLGRTIAHELGHLILGTTDHTDDGLMQARWSDGALRLGMMRDVRFSPFDVERMAAMLTDRRAAAATALAAPAVAVAAPAVVNSQTASTR